MMHGPRWRTSLRRAACPRPLSPSSCATSPSIPERTRRRVLLAAEQLGYVYNRGAASLRSAQTHLIGLAVNDLTNPYFAEVTAAIENALTAQDRIVIMSNTGKSVERQSAFAATVREYNVDGLLLVPATGTDAAFVELLRSWRLPFVMVSRLVPGAETDLVQANHYTGMMAATNHLIGLGHRRVGFIGLNADISTGRERLEGYRQALMQSGIEFEPQLVLSGAAIRDVGMAQISTLLDLPDPPTAAVCFNDVLALGAMLGLRARNMTPGIDFSITGFDDIAEATLWRPALTSVSVARKLVGQKAASVRSAIIPTFNRSTYRLGGIQMTSRRSKSHRSQFSRSAVSYEIRKSPHWRV